eukprot:Gb_03890 [translate_table: standard]
MDKKVQVFNSWVHTADEKVITQILQNQIVHISSQIEDLKKDVEEWTSKNQELVSEMLQNQLVHILQNQLVHINSQIEDLKKDVEEWTGKNQELVREKRDVEEWTSKNQELVREKREPITITAAMVFVATNIAGWCVWKIADNVLDQLKDYSKNVQENLVDTFENFDADLHINAISTLLHAWDIKVDRAPGANDGLSEKHPVDQYAEIIKDGKRKGEPISYKPRPVQPFPNSKRNKFMIPVEDMDFAFCSLIFIFHKYLDMDVENLADLISYKFIQSGVCISPRCNSNYRDEIKETMVPEKQWPQFSKLCERLQASIVEMDCGSGFLE